MSSLLSEKAGHMPVHLGCSFLSVQENWDINNYRKMRINPPKGSGMIL